jgi:hypothetical protein
MPGGRPTQYKPEFCAMLIEHMRQGRSFPSFAGVVGVCFDTLYEWAKVHEEFSEAQKVGRAHEILWWESLLQGGAAGQVENFNAAATIFALKNKARQFYRDRYELEAVEDHRISRLKQLMKDPVHASAALQIAEAMALQDNDEK